MLGVRLDRTLDRRLTAEARRRHITKSQLAREAIAKYLAADDLAARAREQSLRVSRRKADEGLHDAHDDREWTP
jgi:predicted transcriptional regulator